MPRTAEDLSGRRFGRLLVVDRDAGHQGTHAYWLCECDCGNEKAVTSHALRSGSTKSCGCLRRENTTSRNASAPASSHGHTAGARRSPAYNSWSNMIRRVTWPDHPRWKDWGGRGITVCDRWRSFENFLADMGERPSGTTLDRIDNDGNYEPGNCRWATPRQQSANNSAVKLTHKKVLEIQHLHEQELPVNAIAQAVGIRRQTVGTVCTVLDALKGAPTTDDRRLRIAKIRDGHPVCPHDHRKWGRDMPMDRILTADGGWNCPGILLDGSDCGSWLPA